MNERKSCVECVACCKGGMVFRLNREELAFMEEGGNTYKTILPADPDKDWSERRAVAKAGIPDKDTRNAARGLKRGEGFYWLIGVPQCTYLTEENLCSVYNDRRRPTNCENFPRGSEMCLVLREENGISDEGTPVSIKSRPQPQIVLPEINIELIN